MDLTLHKLAEIVNSTWEDLQKAAIANDKEAAIRILIHILNLAKSFENLAVLLHGYLTDTYVVQAVKDISWIEGEGCYCWIHPVNANKVKYKVRGMLKDFEVFFALFQFQRVHKSYLVHLPNIVRVATDSGYALMDTTDKVDISDRYRKEFLEIYARFLRGQNLVYG